MFDICGVGLQKPAPLLFVSTEKTCIGGGYTPLPRRKIRSENRETAGQGCLLEWLILMPDYQKMYLTMFQASEEAINLLIRAQRECEELFMSSPEPEIEVLEHKNRPASK